MIRNLVIIVCTMVVAVVASGHAVAYNPLSAPCNSTDPQVTGSAVCTAQTSDPITGSNGIVRRAANVIAAAAGLIAVVIIIIAGFQYINSGGDPAKAKSAKTAIIYALIGLVVIALADSLLGYVLSKI